MARLKFDHQAWTHPSNPETVLLIRADETDITQILTHESLHITLYQIGESDTSILLDREWVLARLNLS